MSIVEHWQESQKGTALFGKCKCPRNYVLKPGCNPYKMIPNPRTKHMSERQVQHMNERYHMKLNMWIHARDKQGNKVQDFNSYYQPEVSKAWVVEHIYDPLNPICKMQCRGRCLRGMGSINTMTIKRLGNNDKGINMPE